MRIVRRSFKYVACLGALASALAIVSAQTPTEPVVDHIHLNVPDVAKGVEWYQKFFGGQPMKEGPDRLMFGETRLNFTKNDKAQPSAGSVVDHIGWRTPNLAAKASELKAQSVKFTTEPRPLTLASGIVVNISYLEGPSGAKIELVQR